MRNKTDPERVAIYARYSSELQNPLSIVDQVALCRSLIEREFDVDGGLAAVFSDAEKTGKTMLRRSGLRSLLAAAESKYLDLLVMEGLDRISRSLKDVVIIHERLKHVEVRMYTAHEGWITTLHVGVKGAMNAIYLDDLRDKVRRGQHARAREGRQPAGLTYGYRVVRGVVDERNQTVNGIREIDEDQARIVRRIFEEFVAGKSLKAIAMGLNDDGIPSPSGGIWCIPTIRGDRVRGDGILRKEIYRGVLIYNRNHAIVNPVTGRKGRVINPESEWTRTPVPHLRIVDDDLWDRAQRMLAKRTARIIERGIGKRAPSSNPLIHPLTGLVRCGVCGSVSNIANEGRYVCAVARYTKKCGNYRAVKGPQLLKELMPRLEEALAVAPALRPGVVKLVEGETERREALRKSAADLQGRIGRLLTAIEEGIEPTKASARIRELEAELKKKRRMMKSMPPPSPEEAAIRAGLVKLVRRMGTEARGRISSALVRKAFALVVEKIILTPVAGWRQGSRIEIRLRSVGWPALWLLLSEAWPETVVPPPRKLETENR